jgi:hypothetical protein
MLKYVADGVLRCSYRSVSMWTKWHKALALCVVIGLNAFFVLFAMSRALQRGKEWQRAFIAASTVQIIIEIFVYETMECIWIQFIIPSTIHVGKLNMLSLLFVDVTNISFSKNRNSSIKGNNGENGHFLV